MMKRTLFLAACCLSLPSCEKAKEIAAKAQVAVEEVRSDFTVQADDAARGIAPDADLQALVDHNAEGYVFRKDLPFPPHLKVKVVESSRFKGRHFQSTLLGSGAGSIEGEFRHQRDLEMRSGVVSYTLHESLFFPPISPEAENPDAGKKVLQQGGRMEFMRKGAGWIPSGKARDLAVMAILGGKDVAVEFSKDCVMPRPFWFGKKRLQPGDQVILSGRHLGMLGFPGANGEIRMTFTGPEAVGGHPCGVFSVSGAIDLAGTGWVGDGAKMERVSVDSGKVWFSLIHPVVLKEELETVITSKSGEGKKLSSQIQGAASIRIEREWVPGGR